MTSRLSLADAIEAIWTQGGDPWAYRAALTTYTGRTLTEVDAALTLAGPPAVVDPETVAQDRLSQDRRIARQDPHAAQEADHEDE